MKQRGRRYITNMTIGDIAAKQISAWKQGKRTMDVSTRVLHIFVSKWVCIEESGLVGGEDGKDSMHL
jgi:hypothetical protein